MVRQRVELRQEGRMIGSGSTVQDDHAGPLTLVANEEFDLS
jgi:hypothetical protein